MRLRPALRSRPAERFKPAQRCHLSTSERSIMKKKKEIIEAENLFLEASPPRDGDKKWQEAKRYLRTVVEENIPGTVELIEHEESRWDKAFFQLRRDFLFKTTSGRWLNAHSLWDIHPKEPIAPQIERIAQEILEIERESTRNECAVLLPKKARRAARQDPEEEAKQVARLNGKEICN